MRQSKKLESYKNSPRPENALHIRYNFITGDTLKHDEDRDNPSYSESQQLQVVHPILYPD